MKKVFFAFLVFLVCVFAVPVFAQLRPLTPPGFPTPPTATQFSCQPDEDHLYFSNWGNSAVNELCYSPKTGRIRTNVLFEAPGITRILPTSYGAVYAMSYNHAYKYSSDPYYGSYLDSWRVMSGGAFAFNPDPEWEQSLSFRFPWESESYKTWLFWDKRSFNEPLPDNPRNQCLQIVTVQTYEFCLNPSQWYVFQPLPTSPFDSPADLYSRGKVLFAGRQPVNIVASGNTLYLTLGTKYEYVQGQSQPRITLGQVIASRIGRDGTIQEEILDIKDIPADIFQDRLTATANGLYYVSQEQNRDQYNYVLWFYSFKNRNTVRVLIGGPNDFFSGLAAAATNK